MADLIKTLNNLHLLRSAINSVDLKQAESILAKVQRVIEEKREAQAKLFEQQKARQELINKYKEQLKQDGISLAELNLEAVEEKKTRAPLAPKYKFIDENGVEKFWTGQGRTPLALQKALAEGKSLDSFKI